MVELIDGFLIELQAISPCNLFFVVPAFGTKPPVVTLSSECPVQCKAHCHSTKLGFLLRDGEVFGVLLHEVLAWFWVWGFAAPIVDSIGGHA